MKIYQALSEAFCYPGPSSLELLETVCLAMPDGGGRQTLQDFLGQIQHLSLGAWEELYTQTWDLAPLTAPYIGYQIWGEDYRRGKFMADLQGAYQQHQVDTGSELPDHLVPVLRYLETAQQPLPELVEIFKPAVEKMAAVLQKRHPGNPYLILLRWMAQDAAGITKSSGR
jgi:nitrate reductase molybdenum cofactor assembly chaperone NarJ/NarW